MQNQNNPEEASIQDWQRLLDITAELREIVFKGIDYCEQYECLLQRQKDICQRITAQKGLTNLPLTKSMFQQFLSWNKEICTRMQAEQKRMLAELKECAEAQKALAQYRTTLTQGMKKIDKKM